MSKKKRGKKGSNQSEGRVESSEGFRGVQKVRTPLPDDGMKL